MWLLVRARKRNKAIGRFSRRIGLFPAVFLALRGGLVVAFAAYKVLRRITPVDPTKPAAQIDVARIWSMKNMKKASPPASDRR